MYIVALLLERGTLGLQSVKVYLGNNKDELIARAIAKKEALQRQPYLSNRIYRIIVGTVDGEAVPISTPFHVVPLETVPQLAGSTP